MLAVLLSFKHEIHKLDASNKYVLRPSCNPWNWKTNSMWK